VFGLVSSDDDNLARSLSRNPAAEPVANKNRTEQTNYITTPQNSTQLALSGSKYKSKTCDMDVQNL